MSANADETMIDNIIKVQPKKVVRTQVIPSPETQFRRKVKLA